MKSLIHYTLALLGARDIAFPARPLKWSTSPKELAAEWGNEKRGRYSGLLCIDQNIQNLIQEAIEAREFAYCPYSNFKRMQCRKCLFHSWNMCERCAYAKAISQGKQKFKAIAVIAAQERYYTTPCGACRQFMSEFGNIDIYLTKPSSEDVFVASLEELLPHQFKT
ncbi:hypothetical protein NQ317_016046, partial [Molorchus minor]